MKNKIITLISTIIIVGNVFSQQATISGKLVASLTNIDNELYNVRLTKLTDGSIQTVELDQNLNYTFTAETGHNYELTMLIDSMSQINIVLNGVSTLDMVMIQRHILGIQQLDNGFKVIAADVNLDNRVTAFDLVQIRRLILGIDTQFSHGRSWLFVSQNSLQEKITIDNLQSNSVNNDFVPVKLGDVNGNAIGG